MNLIRVVSPRQSDAAVAGRLRVPADARWHLLKRLSPSRSLCHNRIYQQNRHIDPFLQPKGELLLYSVSAQIIT
jgi:hypothetical protein